MKNYGFLVCHPVHINHVLSIILELSRLTEGHIVVLSTGDAILDRLRTLLDGRVHDGRIRFQRAHFEHRAIMPKILRDRLRCRVGEKIGAHHRKSHWLTGMACDFLLRIMQRAVRGFTLFDRLDVVVCPGAELAWLKGLAPALRCRCVYCGHGSGDGAEGFHERLSVHDMIFVSGRYIRDRLASVPGIESARIKIVGYPKFDICERTPRRRDLFGNRRMTVLYNPHYRMDLSSWDRWGLQVLNHFLHQNGYNLIFSPHIHLYLGRSVAIPDMYDGAEHMIIDRGSDAMLDMSYVGAADIYLGDVSSQVYEFIQRPKPCIFLNAHGVRWSEDPDYRHWTLGPVMDDLERLPDLLHRLDEWGGEFVEAQVRAVEERFERRDEVAGRNAARHLVAFAHEGGRAS
jgi:hypothetical protein